MELSLWLCFIVIWTLFSELTAQTYDGAHKGHTAFPTDIPANTIEIYIQGNNINSFPYNAFDKFYQLEKVNIGDNPFTQLPNIIPIGDTLKVLLMGYCKLTELNAGIFNELVVLEDIYLRECPLTSFPDVGGPGNTLWKIVCYECKLSTFPLLSNYKALKHISFIQNPMTSVPEAAVASVHLSGGLYLDSTAITSLPQYPKGYENLTLLRLQDTTVSFFLVPLNYRSKLYKLYNIMSYKITNLPWNHTYSRINWILLVRESSHEVEHSDMILSISFQCFPFVFI